MANRHAPPPEAEVCADRPGLTGFWPSDRFRAAPLPARLRPDRRRPLALHVPTRPARYNPIPGIALGLVLLLALGSLAACKGGTKKEGSAPAPEMQAAAGPPVTGDWLVEHLLSDPEQLNPLTSNDATASTLLSYMVESLLDRDPDTLALRPLLARSLPEISADHLTYTFHLRPDARFSDGKPVTGADVLFSIKAIKCTKVNAPFLRVYFASITGAELVDPLTIRFTAAEPYFLNESVLGGISVLPKHYYDPQGELDSVTFAQVANDDPATAAKVTAFAGRFNRDFARAPLGSGPYTFGEWKTGERVILVRNPDYWGYGHEGLETPYIDRLVFKIVNNTDAALVTLKAGDLDVMGLDPLQHLRQTDSPKFKESFSKVTYYSPSYTYLGWNNDHPIFHDPAVRRAMTMLIDREAMVKTILFDLGQVINGPIYRFRPEYDESIAPPPFDPSAAEKLLDAAGWKDSDGDGIRDKVIDGRKVPFTFEIKINSGNEVRKSVALTIQDALRKHGIEVKIREIDWTIFLDDVQGRHFDAVVLGWAMSVNEPDAYQVWHSSQIDNGGSNFIGYRDARVDEILTEYRRTFDAQKRIALYKEFQQILNRDQPYTFLFMRKSVVAYQRRFQNVKALPIGGVVVSRWWVPKALQRYGTVQAPTP
jgi:peptide/nickel transport system substrate-binding protein